MSLFKKVKQPAEHIDSSKEVQDLRFELQKLKEDLDGVKKMLNKALVKVGMARFNPFNDVGGDQSFTIALLDQENTGIVVTSHYGRDVSRVYAKPIKEGKSEYSLSKEEEKILAKVK